MSTTGRPAVSTGGELATQLSNAEFVRFVAGATGESIAATGLLANALDGVGVPYQLSVTPLTEPTESATETDLTVAIGRPGTTADLTIDLDSDISGIAHDAATELGTENLVLALAGSIAADGHPGNELASRAAERGIERRPGLGVPTADAADGLAHSTLVHTHVSGDVEAAESMISSLDPDETASDGRREVASRVALAVAGDDDGTERGATQIEGLLRPLAGGPFETIAGYADVLDVLAREEPGLAVALILDSAAPDEALDAWRSHATTAHEAVRNGRTTRHDGLLVVRVDEGVPVDTVARLIADFRSPEPLVLVVGDDGAVAARSVGEEPPAVGALFEQALAEFDGTGGGTPTWGRATVDVDPAEFIAAFKEAV